MNPLTSEIGVSLSRAAALADVHWVQIRNWLDRDQIILDADKKRKGQHRRFGFLDILRIAVMGRLTRYGIPAEQAGLIVQAITIGSVDVLLQRWADKPTVLAVGFDSKKQAFLPRMQELALEPGGDLLQFETVLIIGVPHIALRLAERVGIYE